jgi:O-antigen ligase/polysaccharide polymerase Wzy-like membrane protein/carbohydrate binding protein with CBM4/9 domain
MFLLALVALLLGYMFLGRGFAHLGLPPIYVGEVVLIVGLVATGAALIRLRLRFHLSLVVWVLLGFMVLGLARTVPYLGTYGVDALRDAVLWGYAVFALMIYVLADRAVVLGALRLYAWVVPVFAIWLPIAYSIFAVLGASIQADELGSNVPIVFFKSGDMAVHIVGSIAFLVLAAGPITKIRTLGWRTAIAVPLAWTALLVGATNRGGLVTIAVGVAAIIAFAILFQRSRNWGPVLIAPAVLAMFLGATGIFNQFSAGAAGTTTRPDPHASGSMTASPPDESPPVATVTCEASPASRSLVANPGFELGTDNNGKLEGWTTWAGLYNIVGGGGYRGANYASIQNTGEAWTATITSTMFAFQTGRDISVSLWAKAIGGRPVIATYVNWYDRSDTRISSVYLTSTETDGRSTWQESTGALTAPAGTTHATVQLYETAGHATIGLDEVIVKSGHFVQRPPAPKGRPATIEQIIENITSIFSSSSDNSLEGSKEFRLRWWRSIINYTIFGDYFWTGKGFGVNLADADGFQANADRSLRSPHNSHIATLAHMGVPGFVLWLLLQGAFGIGLLRSVLAHRRAGMARVATIGAWILVYWVAMMVNTSFDPYLEGPQGGIWFWSVFGLGMVVMRLAPTRPAA